MVGAGAVVSGIRGRDGRSRGVSGDTTLVGLSGPVRADTVSGNLEAQAVTGDLRFNSVSGDLTVVEGAGLLRTGRLGQRRHGRRPGPGREAHGHPADHASRARSRSGCRTRRTREVEANTASGAVSNAFDGSAGQRPVGREEDHRPLGAGTGKLKATTVSGSIALLRRPPAEDDPYDAGARQGRCSDMPPVFAHGRLRLYLLKLLDEAPRHGYEVIRLLEERFQGLYAPSAGTVYPRLAKLEAEGLVTHATEGGRKVYPITDAGRAELADRSGELADLELEIRESVSELAAEIRDDVRGAAGELRSEMRAAACEARRSPRRRRKRDRRTTARSGTSTTYGDKEAWRTAKEELRRAKQEWKEQARRAKDESRRAREEAQQARRQAKEAQERARARRRRRCSASPGASLARRACSFHSCLTRRISSLAMRHASLSVWSVKSPKGPPCSPAVLTVGARGAGPFRPRRSPVGPRTTHTGIAVCELVAQPSRDLQLQVGQFATAGPPTRRGQPVMAYPCGRPRWCG